MLAVVLVSLVVAASAAQAHAAGMYPVLNERFDALDTSVWDLGYWYGPWHIPGDTTLLGGVLAAKPGKAKGTTSLETSPVVVTALPARITFKVRYPKDTYRTASFGLAADRDRSLPFSLGTAGGIWWGLGKTSRMVNAHEGGFFVSGADGSQRVWYPADGPMPLIPTDTWLDGEVWLYADRFEAHFNGKPIVGTADLAGVVARKGGLRLGFVTGLDEGRNGIELDEVIVAQARPVAEVGLEIEPGRLNARSKGRWVTAHVLSTADADVSGADVATVRVSGAGGVAVAIPAAAGPTSVEDFDGDGRADLMVKFERAALIGVMTSGKNPVTVAGSLADGTAFEGSTVVTLIGGKKAPAKRPRGRIGRVNSARRP